MGLFTVNIAKEDRERIDRILNFVDLITTGKQLVIRISLENRVRLQPVDDIQK